MRFSKQILFIFLEIILNLGSLKAQELETSVSSLIDFPSDLLKGIYSKLSCEEQVTLSYTCKTFQKIHQGFPSRCPHEFIFEGNKVHKILNKVKKPLEGDLEAIFKNYSRNCPITLILKDCSNDVLQEFSQAKFFKIIRHFEMEQKSIEYQDLKSLLTYLKGCAKLRIIHLKTVPYINPRNKLENPNSLDLITEGLTHHQKHLKEFSCILPTYLEGNAIESSCNVLKGITGLKTLSIGFSRVDNYYDKICSFVKGLQNIKSLEKLTLEFLIKITKDAVKKDLSQIITETGKIPSLKFLTLKGSIDKGAQKDLKKLNLEGITLDLQLIINSEENRVLTKPPANKKRKY